MQVGPENSRVLGGTTLGEQTGNETGQHIAGPAVGQRVNLSPDLSRHILGLFQGQPGARAWRRHLSQQAHRPGEGQVGIVREEGRERGLLARGEDDGGGLRPG